MVVMVVMVHMVVLMVLMEAVIAVIVLMAVKVLMVLVLGKGGFLVVDVSKLLGSIMAALGTDITLGKGIV